MQGKRTPSSTSKQDRPWPWVKLRLSTLTDSTVMQLPDRLFRRYLEAQLVAAGEPKRDGTLPDLQSMAWLLRVGVEELESDMVELARIGLAEQVASGWRLSRFASEQAATPVLERVRAFRSRKVGNVTTAKRTRNGPLPDKESESDSDSDGDREEDRNNNNGAGAPVVAAVADPVLLSDLHAFGIPETTARTLIARHSRERITDAAIQVSEAIARGEARNPGGLLRHILEASHA